MKIPTKKLTFEDRFDRNHACWANNHTQGWKKYKRNNRKELRRKIKKGEFDDA